MKKFIRYFIPFELIFIMLFSGCSPAKIDPDLSINEKIQNYTTEHSELLLDEVTLSWDNVLIDSAYSVETALEKLEISNRSVVHSIPYEDEKIVLVFIRDDLIVSYTIVNFKNGTASDYIQNYLYQNTGEMYPKGTVFKK